MVAHKAVQEHNITFQEIKRILKEKNLTLEYSQHSNSIRKRIIMHSAQLSIHFITWTTSGSSYREAHMNGVYLSISSLSTSAPAANIIFTKTNKSSYGRYPAIGHISYTGSIAKCPGIYSELFSINHISSTTSVYPIATAIINEVHNMLSAASTSAPVSRTIFRKTQNRI